MSITVGRLWVLLAGIWFILMACAQLFSLAVPGVLLGILALVAGICAVISALSS